QISHTHTHTSLPSLLVLRRKQDREDSCPELCMQYYLQMRTHTHTHSHTHTHTHTHTLIIIYNIITNHITKQTHRLSCIRVHTPHTHTHTHTHTPHTNIHHFLTPDTHIGSLDGVAC